MPSSRYNPLDAAFIEAEEAKRQSSVFNTGQVKPVTLSFEGLRFEVDVGDKKHRQVQPSLDLTPHRRAIHAM